jgi:hypothetical protein
VAKASTVINRALRLIGVAQTGEALDAEIAEDALSVFNSLLAEWYGNIAIPDYNASTIHTDLTVDDGDIEALAYQLAIRLAPEFDQQLSPAIMESARESMTRLRNRYFVQGSVDFSELPVPDGYGFNIQNA